MARRENRNTETRQETTERKTKNVDLETELMEMKKMMETLLKYREGDNKTLTDMKRIITEQRQEIKELRATVTSLEDRVDDLEQYTRKEDIIVSGLSIKRSTYADAAKGESGLDSDRDSFTRVEDQVLEALSERGVSIREEEISACHTLGKRKPDGTQTVIVRFVSRKSKVRTMMDAKKLKGTGIYINEHLTRKNGRIAKEARDLKKAGRITGTWVKDCKVWIRNRDGNPVQIRSVDQLSQL